jgi:8-oxo-dGTP pyrophosphatase MutT (NUDIX family)
MITTAPLRQGVRSLDVPAKRPSSPNEISAGGVVVRPSGGGYEVCLISDGHYWGLPKGIIEPGEQPEEAALREIAEETGLPRESLTLRGALPSSDYVYRRRDTGRLIFKRVHHFLVEAPADAELHPDPAEIADAAWLSFADALRRVSFRDTTAALREAERLVGESAQRAD